jgi:hypothetical protein
VRAINLCLENAMKAITALVFSAAILLLPMLAAAQSNDAAYCAALAEKFDAYLDTAGDKGGRATPTDVAIAAGKCKSDPAGSIPVLEKALKAARLSLPSRG